MKPVPIELNSSFLLKPLDGRIICDLRFQVQLFLGVRLFRIISVRLDRICSEPLLAAFSLSISFSPIRCTLNGFSCVRECFRKDWSVIPFCRKANVCNMVFTFLTDDCNLCICHNSDFFSSINLGMSRRQN